MSRVKVDIENGQRLYNEALKALPGEAALQFADTLALQRLPAACPVNLETIAWYPGVVRNEEVLEALLSDDQQHCVDVDQQHCSHVPMCAL